MGGETFLPYGRQQIDDDDVAAVAAVLRGDRLTSGPAVDAFEAALAARLGAGHAVACSSGTAALHLALLGLGIGPGDTAIVPAVTFLATANAARFVGAEVAFADVDPDSCLMRVEDAERALAAAVASARVVLPVHLNGQCADPEAIARLARGRGIAVVDDACHALGTGYRGGDGAPRRVGDAGDCDMAVFSFHPVKTIAMGEGGAITTNDAGLDAQLRRLRSHGIVRDPAAFENPQLALDGDGGTNPWYHEMPELGFNYRASDIHCALGLSQLGKLDRFVAKRAERVAQYDRRIAALAPLVVPVGRVGANTPAWHLYVVLIDFGKAGTDRAAVINRLRENGIGTQVHYLPVHHQPYYRRRYGASEFPGADSYYARCLSLP